METSLEKVEKKLPKIEELFSGSEELISQNKLNVLLNQPPPDKWINEHPFVKVERTDNSGKKIKVPLKYLPIERIEFLLTAIFIEWSFEIKDVKLIGNSVVVTGTLVVNNPITSLPMRQDGIGAMALQTDQGAGAIEFNKLKSSSVMMAAPAAESFAIKDAAEKFGKIFGKDLNRKEDITYDGLLTRYSKVIDFKFEMNECETVSDLEDYYDSHPELLNNVEFTNEFKRRVNELSGTN